MGCAMIRYARQQRGCRKCRAHHANHTPLARGINLAIVLSSVAIVPAPMPTNASIRRENSSMKRLKRSMRSQVARAAGSRVASRSARAA